VSCPDAWPRRNRGHGRGQMAVTSASGTNQFHGSAFEFVRNDIFDARSFIDDTKPPFRLNQFGGSLGGPIVRDRPFSSPPRGYRQTLDKPWWALFPRTPFAPKRPLDLPRSLLS